MHAGKSAGHDFFEFGVYFVKVPAVAVEVLRPFEVADGDAAGVGENVGNDDGAFLVEYVVRFGSGWPVRKFENDVGVYFVRVVFVNDVFKRGGGEDVDGQFEKFFVGECFCAGKAADFAGFFFVFAYGIDVKAVFVVNGAAGVGDGDDGVAFFCDDFGEPAAYVAESLDGDGAGLVPVGVERFSQGEVAALGGCFVPAEAAAELNRLAGDGCGDVLVVDFLIFVEHPGHDLAVCVDVRRGNVFPGADVVAHGFCPASADGLEFFLGEFFWVARDAAFSSAVWDVDDGAFEAHPCCERFYFVKVNVGVEADAAFVRPA